MIYKSKMGDIDLKDLTRLYPAVVIDMQGEVAEMSLEWFDLYGKKVKFISFVLVFDYTNSVQEDRSKTVLEFKSKDELIIAMQEVSKLIN